MSYEAAQRRILDRIEIPVEEIREGDQFIADDGYHHWTAIADADPGQQMTTLNVRFRDGGTSIRTWDPGTTIKVLRP